MDIVIFLAFLLFGIPFVIVRKYRDKKWINYIPTFLIWLFSICLFIYGYITVDIEFYMYAFIIGQATVITFIITLIIEKLIDRKKN